MRLYPVEVIVLGSHPTHTQAYHLNNGGSSTAFSWGLHANSREVSGIHRTPGHWPYIAMHEVIHDTWRRSPRTTSFTIHDVIRNTPGPVHDVMHHTSPYMSSPITTHDVIYHTWRHSPYIIHDTWCHSPYIELFTTHTIHHTWGPSPHMTSFTTHKVIHYTSGHSNDQNRGQSQ